MTYFPLHIFSLSLILVGCASAVCKPGGTMAELRQARYECSGAAAMVDPFSHLPYLIDRHLNIRECLAAKGWVENRE